MILNKIPTECTIVFMTSLSLNDLKSALDKVYPDELLGLKLKETESNVYQFQEYCPSYVNPKSLVAFEFLKMICCEHFDFKPVSFKITPENQPESTINDLYNYFSSLNKTNDFFEEFLKDWEIACDSIKTNKIPTVRQQIDSNKTSALFENCYNFQYTVRIVHNSIKKEQISKILTTFYSDKSFHIRQVRKNMFDLTDNMSYCSGFTKLGLIHLIKLSQNEQYGFKLLNLNFKTSEQSRLKWIKTNEIPVVENCEDFDKFQQVVKSIQTVQIEQTCSNSLYFVRFVSEIPFETLVTIFQHVFQNKTIELKKINKKMYDLHDVAETEEFDYSPFIAMCRDSLNGCSLQSVCVKEKNQKRWKWLKSDRITVDCSQQILNDFNERFKHYLELPQKVDRNIKLGIEVFDIAYIKNMVEEFEKQHQCKPILIFPTLDELLKD